MPPLTYRHAHWGFLLALAAIVAGFWPSFFRSLSAGETWHTVHGVTATLWVVALAVQSYLISPGLHEVVREPSRVRPVSLRRGAAVH